MSPILCVFTRLWRHRGGLLLAGLVLLLTAGGGGAVLATRPVADTRSTPVEPSTPAVPAAAPDTTVPAETAATPAASAARTVPPPAIDPGARLQPPSPRYSAAMAYDGARRDVVLFGGAIFANGGQTFLSDTWTWDGHRWTQRHPAHAPSARAWSEIAYDPVHRQVVLFGGLYETDTWLWDGSDWRQARPAFVPQQTIEDGMTFSAATGTVLMYSGGMELNHLYSWDGANWTDLPFTGGPPPIQFQGGLAVDPVRGVVVLLAFDINQVMLQQWEFDGRVWTHRDVTTPPARSLVQMATDERTRTIVMFGGIGNNETWTWDGTQWTLQHPRHSPSVRTSTGPMPGMAYDAARGEVVVFGGVANGVALNDTWTWNGRDWTSS